MNTMTKHIQTRLRSLCAVGLSVAALAAFHNPATAADLYWSYDGLNLGGFANASFPWDNTGAQWATSDAGPFTTVWTNGVNAGDTAVFTNVNRTGGSQFPATVNIPAAISAGGLRFAEVFDVTTTANVIAWPFLLSGTNSLDLGTSGATIFANSGTNTPLMQGYNGVNIDNSNLGSFPGAYIPEGHRGQGGAVSVPISGSGILTKDGPGYLYLRASNTYSGTLAINQGALELGENVAGVENYNSLQNITNITMADGTRLGAYATNVDIIPPITLSGGTVTINGAITPVANTSQSALYKKTFIKGPIRGSGNVVFAGLNAFGQYNQIILATNCTYNGSTLLTCRNFDLFRINFGGALFSQQNFNNQFGLQLAVDNALPTTTVLTMDGEMAITSASQFSNYSPANNYAQWRQTRVLDLHMAGKNQTLAGLNNTNRFCRTQRIINLNANAPSTLTISNTADCTFSGSVGNLVMPGINTAAVGVQGVVKTTNHLDGNNLALVKAGPGTLTLMGPPIYTSTNDFTAYINAYGNAYANGTTINGGTLIAANSVISWTNTYAGTVINVASATGSGAVTINSGGTLGGTGSIGGVVTNNAGGTLSPGTSIGTLTLNGNVVLNAGSTNTFEVNGTTPANDQIVLGAAVTYGGVLKIVPSGSFTVGQTFTLFSGAGATTAGNFSSIEGSAGSGQAFSFTNGVLSVVSAGPSGPATLTSSVSGSTLTFTWPAGQGWTLKSQTNSVSSGLNPAASAWFSVPGGVDGSNSITIDPANPTVFYRLVYP